MNNILTQMEYGIAESPGDGILVYKPVGLFDWHLASSGAVLTTTLSTNPGQDVFDTNMVGLSWAAAKVVAAGLAVQIPQDYDEAKDVLKLRLRAKMSGSTDTPTFSVAAYKDDATTTDLAPSASAALGSTMSWVEIDLSSNGFTVGEVVQIVLTPAAHGTDAIQVFSAEIEYASTVVANYIADRGLNQ